MKKEEFKNLIKEAIMELVAEGRLAMGPVEAANVTSNKKLNEIQAKGNNLANLIKQANPVNPSIIKKESPQQNALLNILADTAQTTLVKQQQVEQFGMTGTDKQKFDNLFPTELKNHFEKLFPKV